VAELEKVVHEKEDEITACESKEHELSMLLQKTESSCGAKSTVGFGVDVEENCEKCTVDLSLFTKISSIFYKNLAEPYYEDVYLVGQAQLAFVYALVIEYGTLAVTEVYNLAIMVYGELTKLYTAHVSPMVADLYKELQKFYKENLKEALDPVVAPAYDVVSQLEVKKVFNQVYTAGSAMAADAMDVVGTEVLPILKSTVGSVVDVNKLTWANFKAVVFQPDLLGAAKA